MGEGVSRIILFKSLRIRYRGRGRGRGRGRAEKDGKYTK